MESLVGYQNHLLYVKLSQTASNKREGDLKSMISSFWNRMSHVNRNSERVSGSLNTLEISSLTCISTITQEWMMKRGLREMSKFLPFPS